MSKKSRKRNKKILAAIGLGLGAAALASKKKAASASDVEANDNAFRINDKKPSIAAVSGDKKSTAKPAKKETPTVKTKKTIQDNKYDPKKGKFGTVTKKDETGQNITTKITPFKKAGLTLGVSKNKRSDNYKGYATKTGNSRGDLGTTGKPEKKDYFGATVFPRSQAADNFKADNREYKGANQSYEGRKSGGRAGYKSGGSSVKKSMGKALRGGGKVIR